MRRLCVTETYIGQRKHNEIRAVLYLCLALDWRWSNVILASTFTREKTLTFLNIQKVCVEVGTHDK